MVAEERRVDPLAWLARAAEVFAFGSAVLLLVALWKSSRQLSPAERIVLFGSTGAGMLSLLRGVEALNSGRHQ